MEYALILLNNLILNSNGTFKLEYTSDYGGMLAIKSNGFQYYFNSGIIDLEELTKANIAITAQRGISEGWITPKKAGE